MRAAATLGVALAATLLALPKVWAQTPYPDLTIQDVTWTDGTHHIAVTQPILSPSTPDLPVEVSGTVDAEFVSGTQVRLRPGFHAGGLTGAGRFHAYIDNNLGSAGDVVVVSPDPATAVVDNVLHVNKWEKLEIGFELPQEYTDAIERFFDHYYPNAPVIYSANPSNTDAVHDLNPYADDSLRLVLTLTSPSGVQRMKWGYYMRESMWENAPDPDLALLTEDTGSTLFPYHVRFRFAPDEEGPWQFALSIQAPHTATMANNVLQPLVHSGYSFVCDPPLPDNHGPLAVDTLNRRMLRFADGTPFFGLGTNMGPYHGNFGSATYPSSAPYLFFQRDFDVMKQTMEQLDSVGGNFMRIFMMRFVFAPEWVNLGVYDNYRAVDPCTNGSGMPTIQGNCQYQCWAFDEMLDHARAENIYLQLCVDPYPPIISYESFIWGCHPYMIHFLEPHRQDPPDNAYDLKEFFYTHDSSGLDLLDSGVFYYWKRKYKYIMSRWGYSVNLAAIEPFNEIDQMLSYQTVTTDENCLENHGTWVEDPELPATISNWITDIAEYVRGDVVPDEPASSPLGESNKLFLMSYARDVVTDTAFYLPFTNPNVDLLGVHIGLQWEWTVRNGFDASQAYRNTYVSGGLKKPFHQGEYTTYGNKDIVMVPDTTERATYQYFANYGISFHNELWASAFSGNFAAGTSWGWERVFFWPDAVKKPLPDDLNPAQVQFPPSNFLNDTNAVELGWPITIKVPNKPVHHHFKPLADLLNHPNWQANGFFDGPFSAHRHTIGTNSDETRKIECYWLLREPSKDLAIGWVHNLNAYWEKSWYMTAQNQNLLGCTSPATQSITLPGFAAGDTLYVTFIPTWMNDTIRPANDTVAAVNGNVILDLSTAELHGQVGTLLDTLHSDYAFIIATVPFVKSRTMAPISDPVATGEGWDFIVYPNPAENEVHLRMPDDALRDIMLHDLLGRQVGVWRRMKGPVLTLPLSQLARGTYWIRATNGESSRTKKLIVQ
ncbi:MAG: T9SS type A sorting domain-containing protein [Flavobacteriales bacterium]|nr:T9SS type A sorting domain-containing protein [Flavobacteriales bacterium]